ncbi:MAG: M20/M25/M40 family metallo-hydrolase [Bacteroidales bacterium]|jgi:hypothetical protein|nr:M20/M25/M40 family metallo-hydrolase [Bacteroidales bacterium]
MRKLTLLSIVFSLLSLSIFSQNSAREKGLQAINEEAIKAQLEFLSSDWMEGRATGEKGAFLAADYLASMLQFMNISPAGDQETTNPSREQYFMGIRPEQYTSYFQNIYMTKLLESNTSLSLTDRQNNKTITFNDQTDFYVNTIPYNTSFSAEAVFVGYGFVDQENNYDDFKGVDVKNKIIIRLSGYPGHNHVNSKAYKKFHVNNRYFKYYLNRNKNKIALEKGAIGVIEVPEEDFTRYMATEQDFKQTSRNKQPTAKIYEHRLILPSDTIKDELLEIYVTPQIITRLLENSNINLHEFQENVARDLKPASRKIKGVKLTINHQVKKEIIQTRNVLGVIEGENKDEIIVIGAHYDHLGANDGFVWNGADDNASGTIGVWMLAKAFAEAGVKPKRSIVFAAWTGEERGLLGSKYFAGHPYGGSIEKIKLNINFDMISKDSANDTLKNQARMVYTSSFPAFESMTQRHLKEQGLNLDINYRPAEKPRGGSDHSSFSAKNIPVMYFMAGFPVTYHTPKDRTHDVNWKKMTNIIKLTYLNAWELANSEQW